MRSERKCSIFDLLWPDPSILEGESEKFVFLENKNIFEEKKIHSLSCLTKVYLWAKIETIWIFESCHKNFIFVWFLHGCPLKHFKPSANKNQLLSQCQPIKMKKKTAWLGSLRGPHWKQTWMKLAGPMTIISINKKRSCAITSNFSPLSFSHFSIYTINC